MTKIILLVFIETRCIIFNHPGDPHVTAAIWPCRAVHFLVSHNNSCLYCVAVYNSFFLSDTMVNKISNN